MRFWGLIQRRLLTLFPSYRPERHYMRGPGPKWHEKHDRAEIEGASPAVSRALMAGLRP